MSDHLCKVSSKSTLPFRASTHTHTHIHAHTHTHTNTLGFDCNIFSQNDWIKKCNVTLMLILTKMFDIFFTSIARTGGQWQLNVEAYFFPTVFTYDFFFVFFANETVLFFYRCQSLEMRYFRSIFKIWGCFMLYYTFYRNEGGKKTPGYFVFSLKLVVFNFF